MGLATAQLLASRGAIISLADINEEALKTATASLPKPSGGTTGKEYIYTVVDVRQTQSVDDWIAGTVAKLGGVDGAVNMAGIIKSAVPVARSTDEDWDSTFAVNAKGVYACIRVRKPSITKPGWRLRTDRKSMMLTFNYKQAQIKAMKPGGSIVRTPILIPTFC